MILYPQRRADDGQWDFIGGRVDEDETFLAALHREAFEETGLRVTRARLFVMHDELAELEFWPAARPIRDALLAKPREIVIA